MLYQSVFKRTNSHQLFSIIGSIFFLMSNSYNFLSTILFFKLKKNILICSVYLILYLKLQLYYVDIIVQIHFLFKNLPIKCNSHFIFTSSISQSTFQNISLILIGKRTLSNCILYIYVFIVINHVVVYNTINTVTLS